MSLPGAELSSEFSDPDDSSPAAVAAPAPAAPDGAPPLLDLTAIQTLEDQLDNPLTARAFVLGFTQLWEKRFKALATAIASHDSVAALEAILSVRTSAAMVGGVQLAHLAAIVEDVVRTRDVQQAGTMLARLDDCGRATVAELQSSYVLRNA